MFVLELSTCYFRMDCVYSFLQCAQFASQCQTNEKRESQFSQVAFGKHQSLMHLCCQRVLVNFAIFLCFGLILPWPSCTLIPFNVNVLQGTSSAFPSDLKLQWVYKSLLYSPDPAMSRYYKVLLVHCRCQ